MVNREGAYYLCNLGSIPLFVHPTALVMVLMVANWFHSQGTLHVLVALLVLVSSIVLHELGHGLTAKALGAFNVTITIEALGGVCRSTRDVLPARELPILIAGPAVSYALWGGGYLLYHWAHLTDQSWMRNADNSESLFSMLLNMTWQINMGLAIFNSLPIYPLDGGQVLFNIIRLFPRSWNPARLITLCVSFFVGCGLLIVNYNVSGEVNVYSVVLIGYLLFNAYRALH